MKITVTLDIPDLPAPNAPHTFKLEDVQLTLSDPADPAVRVYVSARSSDVTAVSVVGPGDLVMEANGHLTEPATCPVQPAPCPPDEDAGCCGDSYYYDLRGATINISST